MTGTVSARGPLTGVRILELAGLGPGPFAAQVLAGLGADVLSVRRPGAEPPAALGGTPADRRGRPEVVLDVKDPTGRDLVRRLATTADALVEGFRPGAMERLGLGPDDLLALNPRLVYARVTGYGQDGPLSQVPGHDINYVAIAGALGAMRRTGERPLMPLNLLGDYGGGGMHLLVGVLCGLFEAQRSGTGQVIDAAMVDGVAQLAMLIFGFAATGDWGPPGTNLLDSGAPFYEIYETADGGHMAVGAIEPPFYAELLRILEIDPATAPQWDRAGWPALKARFAEVFATRTRAQWTERFETSNACTTPVLDLLEAPAHPHNVARGTFVFDEGHPLPGRAPRFSTSPAREASPRSLEDVLADWPLGGADADRLRAAEVS